MKPPISSLISHFPGVAVVAALISLTPSPASAQPATGVEAVEGALLESVGNDTDRDGLLDEREVLLGTNPQQRDTDGDGFDDLFEDVYRVFGFDPLVPTQDRDADGLSDSLEQALGTSPTNPDTDGDGYGDFDEVLNAAFGYDPTQPTLDADFDGLTQELEAMLGMSPTNADTDGDGASDFAEFKAGVDPMQPNPNITESELVGTTYSEAMAEALLSVRAGGQFPSVLAAELPYPEVTARWVATGRLRPSSALMQQSVASGLLIDPAAGPQPRAQVPPLYDGYNEIVRKLQDTARRFGGAGPGPRIVRLFRYSAPTAEGRHLYALKISDKPERNEAEPEVLFMGMHHARELITPSITLGLIKELTDKYGTDAMIRRLVNYTEIWVIPVVNPDGYTKALGEMGRGARVDWRKNARKVAERTPENAMQMRLGVDPNRNYAFEHIRTLGAAQIAALINDGKSANGLRTRLDPASCKPDPDSDQYAEQAGFSDVETRAVRDLANNVFRGASEISGFKCSLSWHSYGGEVTHPMGHVTPNGTTPADKKHLTDLAEAFAQATGYTNLKDTWATAHYPTFGDSDDWLYKEKNVFALTVEAYSNAEHGGAGPRFFPNTQAKRDAVVANNVKGGIAVLKACAPADLGDAPDVNVPGDYPTRRGNNGAIHLDYLSEWLGSTRDPRPSVSAEVDAIDPFDEDQRNNLVDQDGFDDGVILPSTIRPGVPFDVIVRVNTTIYDSGFGPRGRYESAKPRKRLYLNAWADWAADGSWKQPGDKIIGTGSPTGTVAIDPETFGLNGAYTLGEAFTDANMNGVYDAGEMFTDAAGKPVKDFTYRVTPPASLPEKIWFRFRLDYGEDVGRVPNPKSEPTLKEDEGPAQFGEVEDYVRPRLECDDFRYSVATITLQTPQGLDTVHLMGPTLVKVDLSRLADANGNRLEDVPTEMATLDLYGVSTRIGPVRVRLRDPGKDPFQRSLGLIEETVNAQSGNLDLPPFAASGEADSTFDVYFEIEALGQLLHNAVPKRMRTRITHKPPREGERYEDPTPIDLLSEDNRPTGIRIVNTSHTPNPPPHEVELDYFPNSLATVQLETPLDTELLQLSGPTRVAVHLAALADTDRNEMEQVPTEIVGLELTGESSMFGPVTVRLRDYTSAPFQRSVGQIEEVANTQAGRLDLAPFAPTGAARSDFNLFVEVEVEGHRVHNLVPKRVQTVITHKPPREGETYQSPERIPLVDESGQPTDFALTSVAHTPNPITATVPPLITRHPRPQTVTVGGTATLSVLAIGSTPLGYQWWFDDSPLLGQTAPTLTLSNIQPSQAGAYVVVVSNILGSVVSHPVRLELQSDRPRLARARFSDGMLRFEFGTELGRFYLLQATESLGSPNWMIAAQFPGDGRVQSVTQPATGPARFFRLQIVNTLTR